MSTFRVTYASICEDPDSWEIRFFNRCTLRKNRGDLLCANAADPSFVDPMILIVPFSIPHTPTYTHTHTFVYSKQLRQSDSETQRTIILPYPPQKKVLPSCLQLFSPFIGRLLRRAWVKKICLPVQYNN